MFSRFLRRTHMYVALVLTPWVLMYALSTFVMNHRTWFAGEEPRPPEFELEEQRVLDFAPDPDATAAKSGRQLLEALGLPGKFSARKQAGDLVVQRQHPVSARRIRWNPHTGVVRIERQVFRGTAFLEQLHRRRGYEDGLWLENLWSASVDFFILAVVVWAFSGLWMWWGLPATRKWGAIALGCGLGLFAFFVAAI